MQFVDASSSALTASSRMRARQQCSDTSSLDLQGGTEEASYTEIPMDFPQQVPTRTSQAQMPDYIPRFSGSTESGQTSFNGSQNPRDWDPQVETPHFEFQQQQHQHQRHQQQQWQQQLHSQFEDRSPQQQQPQQQQQQQPQHQQKQHHHQQQQQPQGMMHRQQQQQIQHQLRHQFQQQWRQQQQQQPLQPFQEQQQFQQHPQQFQQQQQQQRRQQQQQQQRYHLDLQRDRWQQMHAKLPGSSTHSAQSTPPMRPFYCDESEAFSSETAYSASRNSTRLPPPPPPPHAGSHAGFHPAKASPPALLGSESLFVSGSRRDVSKQREVGKTTIMLRNTPECYTRDDLTELLDYLGFATLYDFVYVPVSIRTQVAFGYAFVNFTNHAAAAHAFGLFSGFETWGQRAAQLEQLPRTCEVCWSDALQGLDANVQRYRNCPLMHESVQDIYKPAIYKQGVRITFPRPTKAVKAPRIRRGKDSSTQDRSGSPKDDSDGYSDELSMLESSLRMRPGSYCEDAVVFSF